MGASSCLSSSAVALFTGDRHRQKNRNPSLLPSRRRGIRVICCASNDSVKSSRSCTELVAERLPMPMLAEDDTIFASNGMMSFVPYKETNGTKVDSTRGIGIAGFLEGKQLLVTGATGFLAKVLVEKILRIAPDVGKIYVLIKADDKEAAVKRLEFEIINTELFRCLREIHGKDYREFMSSKLVPVIGNIREANVGIEPELADEISKEVDVIINSAANTAFDERYDVALDTNTIGPFRLMSFARRCEKLKLFLHVSTAYVNGQRQGRILEKPFGMGDTIKRETSPEFSAKATPILDIESEIRLAFSWAKTSWDAPLVQKMKDLGLERAKIHGWQDSYVFTKAMGEMAINCMRGDIPVVTIRPSIIESTYSEPFPGWMEGSRMMDPVVLQYGKGQLTGFLADPNAVLDVVPADMVVSAMVAAMAKHGSTSNPGMHIYQITSSVVNPLVIQDLAKLIFQHFSAFPCIDAKGRPIAVSPIKFFDDANEFSAYVSTDAVRRNERLAAAISNEKISRSLKSFCLRSVEQAKHLAKIYEPYTFYGGRFDNKNTQELMVEMSEEERRSFGFDVGSIDWEHYISDVHVPGLRRHVMKGRGRSTEPQLGAIP
ncbi:fatty acyl-CoA reductase 2, chloroplastic [Musa acuminata AAA Group]|uniref:fatty acyl-CoA reductase 2, chloroplastic n=1 Tax=Musa acuminata AAA Group TaxID=214697 RepID=UPI0031DF628A